MTFEESPWIGGVAEVAEFLGVSKQVVVNWQSRYPLFPEPIAKLKMSQIWNMRDIEVWKALGKDGRVPRTKP